jgi:hypothetical protein
MVKFVMKEWISIREASEYFNYDAQLIYRQIWQSESFPQKAKFVKGKSWRRVSARKLQINVEEWENVLNTL